MMVELLAILLVVALAALAVVFRFVLAWRDACVRVEEERDRLRQLVDAYERIDEITLATRRAIRARVR